MYELLKPLGELTAMVVVQSPDLFCAQKHLLEQKKWEKHPIAKVCKLFYPIKHEVLISASMCIHCILLNEPI